MSTAEVENHPLDHAAWASLTGPHAHFAQGTGQALRYPGDVSPIMAISPSADERVWADLHTLVGPGGLVFLSGALPAVPADWQIEMQGDGVQLVATEALKSEPSDDLVTLGAADVPEMLDLVARTQPGPFEPRTCQLGTYLGVRDGGALVAMAGERLHPPGWTEISAVCTDPAHRGRGLATTLVRAVAHHIRERGETPFMHASADNANAIRLYLSMGFELRRHVLFTALRSPGTKP
ncbi:ribosomal protein S18 acetylase RimI-like enzyme [Allocatelliglobosispora scoriae]|uniref:Ribosomal protein S18 acetylase RimI-like enzyme n=1 Tax=Allocatelliglobosispora scoriae TaxID=643052 RepID=A0A841BEW0_9ACTN|nr:GNAT family N-acetyltransferase [Allocatelliglobosispora scoriae]MBB5866834.1 ribosomal protein S18 acetylase RimI-like enzyme [Allocatelliglobosispora scoriae]